jgi:hypothetical protein
MTRRLLLLATTLAMPAICFCAVVAEVGAKVSWVDGQWGYRADPDSAFYNQYAFKEPHIGVSLEFTVSPVSRLYLRSELAELRFYTDTTFGGGWSVQLLSDLNTDLIYVLPIGRRISPLVYGGLSYSRFFDKPGNDIRADFPQFEYHIGSGARWAISSSLALELELELFTNSQYSFLMPGNGNLLWTQNLGGIGLSRVNLGIRRRL